MPPATPEQIHIDVGDAELGVVRWLGAPGAPLVVAVHGITANAWSWAAVARLLDGEIGLAAIDLRGRGASTGAPGPFGIRRHADDVATVIEKLSAAPAVVAGHSMGAFVALACAERHPAAVGPLVLVDGGVPLAVPEKMSSDEVLDALLGPSIERLRTVWPDRVSYRTMWSEHPAFASGLTPELERYVLSDLVPTDGGFRSSVNEKAVRTDGAELLTDPDVRTLLDRRAEPATIVRAEHGLNAAPPPLIPVDAVGRYSQHDWRNLPGTNHYSVLFDDGGAEAVATALRQAAAILA